MPRLSIAVALMTASTLLSQGQLRWTDATDQGAYVLVNIGRDAMTGDHVYDLCVPGFTTLAGTPLGSDDRAVGLLSSPTVVVCVPKVSVLDEQSGDEVDGSPLFPFRPSTAVEVEMARVLTGDVLGGFVAHVGAGVPDYHQATLCFRLESSMNLATLRTVMAAAQVSTACAAVDASGALSGFTIASNILPAGPIVLHFRFDRGAHDLAINYTRYAPARTIADMRPAGGGNWAPGHFGRGSALRGGQIGGPQAVARHCDTGWHAGLGGQVTIAWFMTRRTDPGAVRSDLFGRGMFAGRVRDTGEAELVNWGGAPLVTSANVGAMASAAWVHVAVVIDTVSTAKTAEWFIDGISEGVSSLAPAAELRIQENLNQSFTIGWNRDPAHTSVFDIDEFRIVNEAVGAATILSWVQGDDPGSARFSRNCKAGLSHRGEPRLGTTYRLLIEGPAGSPASLQLGFDAAFPLDLGLAFPYLAGCELHTTPTVSVASAIHTDDLARIALNVPNVLSLSRLRIYGHGVVLDPTLALRISGAYSVFVGQ